MILAEDEIELGTDHSGIMVLSNGIEPGTPLGDVLPLADSVLELETSHNRPDLLAVYGIAREVAALFDLELAPPPGTDPQGGGDGPSTSRSKTTRAVRATSAASSPTRPSARRQSG